MRRVDRESVSSLGRVVLGGGSVWERWQETCLGIKGVGLFGHPNNFDLRQAQ